MAATVPTPLTWNGQICSLKKPMESHRPSAWPCSWAPSEGKRIHGCKSSWHPPFQRIKRSIRSLTYWRNFEPKPLVINECFQFHCRNQPVGKSVAEYVAELRQLTKHCEFGAYLDDAFRDRFVCGLRSKAIEKKGRWTWHFSVLWILHTKILIESSPSPCSRRVCEVRLTLGEVKPCLQALVLTQES